MKSECKNYIDSQTSDDMMSRFIFYFTTMKTTICERCWKEIEARGRRKYCNKCRMEVDHEIAKKYVEKHYKGGKRRKIID